MRLFADDSSLFVRVRDVNESYHKLTTDLETIAAWGFNGKWNLIQRFLNKL